MTSKCFCGSAVRAPQPVRDREQRRVVCHCAYRAVVCAFECPSSAAIVGNDAPPDARRRKRVPQVMHTHVLVPAVGQGHRKQTSTVPDSYPRLETLVRRGPLSRRIDPRPLPFSRNALRQRARRIS